MDKTRGFHYNFKKINFLDFFLTHLFPKFSNKKKVVLLGPLLYMQNIISFDLPKNVLTDIGLALESAREIFYT